MCGTVSCDKDKQLVQVTWLQHCSGAEFRNVMSIALHCATAHQLTAWLCDIRQLYYIEISDQSWMLQHLFPSFDRQRQHQVALVLRLNNFEMTANVQPENDVAFERDFSSFIRMNYFIDKADAEEWLNV